MQHLARRRDEGTTLVEVLVAMALFGIMSTAILATLGNAITMTRDDKFRLTAVNLATRELEITRDTFSAATRGPTQVAVNQVVNPSPLPGGTAGQPLVVDNNEYTVTRTAQWSPVGGAAATACDEGTTSELAYLRVRVEVTWADLGDRPPVTMSTVMTPGKGTYSEFTGHIGVKVIDSLGQPVSGQLVTATGTAGARSGNTASDGCALLAFLDAGTYAVTVSAPGHVDRAGRAVGSVTAQVQPGQLWRSTLEYDRSATIEATFATEPGYVGYALPATNDIPISLANSGLLPSGIKAVPGTGNVRTLANLWPYPSGYQVWAGRCQSNDPRFTGQAQDPPVPSAPGDTSAVVVLLGPVEIKTTGVRPVTATATGTCPAGTTNVVQLGSTNAAGVLKTSLPYGTWSIKAGSGAPKPATIAKGQPQPLTPLVLP